MAVPELTLIDPKDFEGYDLTISFVNNTTQTQVAGGAEYLGNERVRGNRNRELSIELVEVGSESLTLEVPEKRCALGHKLLIGIEIEGRGVKENLTFSSKVKSIEWMQIGRESIVVQLVDHDKKAWESFLAIFNGRQNEIDDFWKAAKG